MSVASTSAEGFETTTARHFVPLMALQRGGMGSVELVMRKQGAFKRLYARKRLHEVYQEDVDFRGMFLDEARIAGLLRHPNVVSVLDVGEDPQGTYLIMDYVDGESVAEILRHLRGHLLPVGVCLEIARQVAEGLHAAHELRGESGEPLLLVHRDVSPQNILVGYDGIVRVTDFGIARALGRTTRTSTGVLKGKMGYMSPEQLRFRHPDRRSDLFALGVVLFELLTSKRLYGDRDGTDAARRILEEPAPDVGEIREDVPDELDQLMFELLAKDREHRPADAGSVARRLGEIVRDHDLDADLAAFMAEAFAAERADKHARIAEAMEQAENTVEAAAPTREIAGSGKRTRTLVLAVLAAGALIGAGVAIGQVLSSPAPPDAQAREPVPRVVSATAEPETSPAPASEPPAEAAAPTETEPARRAARPHRRRPRRRASPTETETEMAAEPAGGGVELPIWGWMR